MARRFETNIGRSLTSLLAERGETLSKLADDLQVSPSYVSQVARGQKRPTAKWLDIVAETMALSPEQTQELHTAGALDAGYKLDLTKP